MPLQEVIPQLESLGGEKRRAHNAKHGAGDNQYGVKVLPNRETLRLE